MSMELPDVSGRMECSNEDFERRCRILIGEEQSKLHPDNTIISILCDGVRLAREYSAAMQTRDGMNMAGTSINRIGSEAQ